MWLLYTIVKGGLSIPWKLCFQNVLNAHPKFSCTVSKQISWETAHHTFSRYLLGVCGGAVFVKNSKNFPENWRRIKIRYMRSVDAALFLNVHFHQRYQESSPLNHLSSCSVLSSLEYYDFFLVSVNSFMRSSSHTTQFTPLKRTVPRCIHRAVQPSAQSRTFSSPQHKLWTHCPWPSISPSTAPPSNSPS